MTTTTHTLTGGNRTIYRFGTDRAVRASLNASGGIILECYERLDNRQTCDLDEAHPVRTMVLRRPLRLHRANATITLDLSGLVMAESEEYAVKWLMGHGARRDEFLLNALSAFVARPGAGHVASVTSKCLDAHHGVGQAVTVQPPMGSNQWVGADDESIDVDVEVPCAHRDETRFWFDDRRSVVFSVCNTAVSVHGYEDGKLLDTVELLPPRRRYTVSVTVTSTYTMTVAATDEQEAKDFFANGGGDVERALDDCDDVERNVYNIDAQQDIEVTDVDDDVEGADVTVD